MEGHGSNRESNVKHDQPSSPNSSKNVRAKSTLTQIAALTFWYSLFASARHLQFANATKLKKCASPFARHQ